MTPYAAPANDWPQMAVLPTIPSKTDESRALATLFLVTE
jgi:hypothetical protein